MERKILKAKKRLESGKKISKNRRLGMVPAVIYGNKIESQKLWVDYAGFHKIYSQVGESAIIDLEMEEKGKASVLIQDVQRDPISGKYLHVDFFQVRMDQVIDAEVPLEFVGESEAVKALGGVLVKSLDSLPISCLPGDLPPRIEVDISGLKNFEDVIKVSDIKLPESIRINIEPETVIANVSAPRSEEELAGLEGKVEEDVTKVEGVVKEKAEAEEKKE